MKFNLFNAILLNLVIFNKVLWNPVYLMIYWEMGWFLRKYKMIKSSELGLYYCIPFHWMYQVRCAHTQWWSGWWWLTAWRSGRSSHTPSYNKRQLHQSSFNIYVFVLMLIYSFWQNTYLSVLFPYQDKYL